MTTRAGRSPHFYAVLGWGAVVASTAAWTSHLLFTAAWAVEGGRARSGPGATCAYGTAWPMHVATVLTAGVCVLALVAAGIVYRHRDDADPGSGTLEGQLRFLGLLGLATAAVNLLLILVEGSYVLFLRSCG